MSSHTHAHTAGVQARRGSFSKSVRELYGILYSYRRGAGEKLCITRRRRGNPISRWLEEAIVRPGDCIYKLRGWTVSTRRALSRACADCYSCARGFSVRGYLPSSMRIYRHIRINILCSVPEKLTAIISGFAWRVLTRLRLVETPRCD